MHTHRERERERDLTCDVQHVDGLLELLGGPILILHSSNSDKRGEDGERQRAPLVTTVQKTGLCDGREEQALEGAEEAHQLVNLIAHIQHLLLLDVERLLEHGPRLPPLLLRYLQAASHRSHTTTAFPRLSSCSNPP